MKLLDILLGKPPAPAYVNGNGDAECDAFCRQMREASAAESEAWEAINESRRKRGEPALAKPRASTDPARAIRDAQLRIARGNR